MRILFNTYPVAFACPGGGEIQLEKCRQALVAQGVEVILFDPWHPQFDQVDLVHYFSVQGGSMNFCDYVKRIGLPLAISPILWLTPENRVQMPLGEVRDLLHLCDRILPNSQAECRQLATEFGLSLEKFSSIPNGVEPRFALAVDPAPFRRHFDIASEFLLNVANIEPRKNQVLLARVAREMRRELVLIGRSRDQAYLDEVLDVGGPMVRYLGPLAHHDPLLRSAYRACRVFVLPSLLETPGLSALEAAAQGARVVVTAEGSTREYFGPHATYVDPLDGDSLRQAIEAKWNAPASGELREHVLANFTWDQSARALTEAYERTLATESVTA